ncbi:beta-lactamase class A [Microvirga flocculans]|uniref:beta-lactamase n=1 Tax=Microvirga flocculans TaxID=217168 RepID=A0A7W6IFD8_9HYPH|nr:class A beta-lactamase [Microvirga flocculans]MBB4039865.1 beta-lactamase class A [Microvirga flocculans]
MHFVRTMFTLTTLVSTILFCPIAANAEFRTDALRAKIEALDKKSGSGRLGVGLVDLTDGDSWSWRGDESFPMQSVYKLPIALAALKAVDEGRRNLDERISLGREDLSIQWSPIAREFKGEPATYTVRQLLEHALQQSDNTASDVLLRLVGGPGSVTALLRRHGIDGMRVDRPEREMQPEVLGLPPFRPEWTNEAALTAALNDLPQPAKRAALAAYLADGRDTATPKAAAHLLAKLARGELLSKPTTRIFLDILAGTRTGGSRIKAGVPEGSTVAHKTGTAMDVLGIGPAVNDAGLVTLPERRQLVVAVFVAGSDSSPAERERLIADVTRAAIEALR